MTSYWPDHWASAGTSTASSETGYAFTDYATTGSCYSGYRIWTNDTTAATGGYQQDTQKIYIDYTNGNHWQETERYIWSDLKALTPKPPTPEEAKKEREQMLKAQQTARELLEIIVPEEKVLQLKKERRIEIVSRNGKIYEILDDGRVNQLLPDGKKQGLCINLSNGPYPADDIIIAKLLLLENDPDKLEEIANKVSPFQLAAMPA